MDWLTFIVEIVKASAWPLAVVLMALLFRRELRALLARIKKGKVGPAEFEFEETVKELEKEAAQLPGPPETLEVPSAKVSLTTSEPRAAIMNAWLEVENALSSLAQTRLGLPPGLARSPLPAIRAIQKAQLIEQHYLTLYNELRVLRNQAAHELDFNPSMDSVLSYVRLAKELTEVLEKAINAN
jgi:hypothetical protein